MENKTPTGYLKWIAINGGNSEKVLHVKFSAADQYRPYTTLDSRLGRSDFLVPSFGSGRAIPSSKGFATAQHLLKLGFIYEPSDPVVDEEVESEGEGGAIGVLREYAEKADVLD